MMPRPCPAMADSVGASWMEAKALTCRVRIMAMAASTDTTSAVGTITDTFCWSPMTRAVVTENTNTPMAKAKVRHTIGSSRNRFSRGDRLLKAHCTTRNSSEKMTVTGPRTPKPATTSVSVTRVLATVASVVILGSSRPSPSPASAHSSCTRPARSRRRGRRNRPCGRSADGCITAPGRRHAGTRSAIVSRPWPPVCQLAGIRPALQRVDGAADMPTDTQPCPVPTLPPASGARRPQDRRRCSVARRAGSPCGGVTDLIV
jgi:hypothetical protein